MLAKIFLISALAYVSYAGQCLGLALEGGGSRGAYEAGVLYGLTNSTQAGNLQWNVVTGISIGALNAGIVALYPMGQEAAMSEFIVSYWKSFYSNDQVYVEWPGGLVTGFLFYPGIYNNAPALTLSQSIYNRPPGRNVTVGSTNMDTGLYGTFSDNLGLAMVDAYISSSSPPFFFPSHLFEGYSWADGGCIMNLDVFSAITRCLDVVNDEKDVTIDIIFDENFSPLPNETSFITPYVFQRAYEIRSLDSSTWYLYTAARAYPDVNFRYVIAPSQLIPGGSVPLNFTQPSLLPEIELGIKDANTAIKNKNKLQGRSLIQERFHRARSNIIYP